MQSKSQKLYMENQGEGVGKLRSVVATVKVSLCEVNVALQHFLQPLTSRHFLRLFQKPLEPLDTQLRHEGADSCLPFKMWFWMLLASSRAQQHISLNVRAKHSRMET